MSDNDKKDLTRIEDLSEFLHSEDDDDLSDIEAALSSDDDNAPTAGANDDEFGDMATDPDINIPDGFNNDDQAETDFTALEDSEETFTDEETSFEQPPEETHDDSEEDFQEDSGLDSGDDFQEESNFDSGDDFQEEANFDSEGDFQEESSFDSGDDFQEETSFDSGDAFQEETNFDSGDDFPEEDNFKSEADFQEEDNFNSEDDFQEESSFDSEDDFSTEENSNDSNDNDEVFQSDDEFDTPDIPDEVFDDESSTEELPPIPEAPLEEPAPQLQEVTASAAETSFGDTQKTALPTIDNSDGYKNPENFKELQHFARNMSFGNMAKEGNPPFSIILKDIKYEEDVQDIIRLLIEYKIINEEDRDDSIAALARGNMLIPRLGEFAAISLCHKLRRFDINILMGLTEEVSPAKDYESDDRGLTTKHNIYNNKQHSWKFEKQDIGINDIIVATTPYIDGHEILEYISIVTESSTVDINNFSNKGQLEEEINLELKSPQKDYYPFNKDSQMSKTDVTLNDIYQSLVEKCKAHVLNKKGNALVGINFQITPLLVDETISIQPKYQITCSGSVVWVNKR